MELADRIASAVGAISAAQARSDLTSAAVQARIDEAERRAGKKFSGAELAAAKKRVEATLAGDAETALCLISLPGDTKGVRRRVLELPNGGQRLMNADHAGLDPVKMAAGKKFMDYPAILARLTRIQAVELARTGFSVTAVADDLTKLKAEAVRAEAKARGLAVGKDSAATIEAIRGFDAAVLGLVAPPKETKSDNGGEA